MFGRACFDRDGQACPAGKQQALSLIGTQQVLAFLNRELKCITYRLDGGRILLEQGAVRIKLAKGRAGLGQAVAHDRSELEAVIGRIDAGEITEAGVVLEQNLAHVATKSVGNVRVAGLEASYCGEQRLTRNNGGAEVYGGSELRFVRGGFDALLSWMARQRQSGAVDDKALQTLLRKYGISG